MTSQVRLELEQLLSALCDGELTGPEHARLESLLNGDAECRRHYLEYVDLHAKLLAGPGLPAGDFVLGDVAPLPARDPRRRARRAAVYLTLIALTLVVSFFVQLLWYQTRPIPKGGAAGDSSPVPALAMLTQTDNCVWEGPGKSWSSGARLERDELKLAKGLARVRFETGQEFVIEGPAVFKIDGASEATLRRGKVVFRGDDTGPTFALHTPSATLNDMGTEYGVLVGAEDEEIHVFDGEVRRAPNGGGEPERLAIGDSRRYRASGGRGEPVSLDEPRFVRQMPSGNRPDPELGLLASESFNYDDGDAMIKGTATGGRGWAGPWRGGPLFFGPRPPTRLPNPTRQSMISPKSGLIHPGESGAGGSFEYSGSAKASRRLASPISLGEDATFYFSFLFRRERPLDTTPNNLNVSLKVADDGPFDPESYKRRITFGIGGGQWGNKLTITQPGTPARPATHGTCTQVPLPLSYAKTYLLVAKIVTHKTQPTEIFIRVYGPDEPVEREETMVWMPAGRPAHSDLTLDSIEIVVNGRRRQTIDEIRLGTTWGSVTAPWSVPEN